MTNIITMNVFVVIVILSALIYVNALKKRIHLNSTIDLAVETSEYNPTEFLIYDKSTKDVCNRLIHIKPFDWYVWATGKELYILNPEGGISCGSGNTPAVRVLKNQFIETCLKIDYDSILRGYMNDEAVLKVVPYQIETRTFTILSALNILVKDWIYFEVDAKSNIGHKIKSIDDYTDDGNNNNNDDDNNNLSQSRRRKRDTEGRELSGDQVSRIVTSVRSGKSHSELLRQYRRHFDRSRRRNKSAAASVTADTMTTSTTTTATKSIISTKV